jgi:hypothetical protein
LSENGRRFLSVHHVAHDFVLEVSPRFLEMNPGAEIEFPHWEAGPGGYRKADRKEPLRAAPFRLDLLPPGRFSLRVTGRTGSRLWTDRTWTWQLSLRIGEAYRSKVQAPGLLFGFRFWSHAPA